MALSSKDYYDSISAGYDELHGAEQQQKISRIKEHLKIIKGHTLLDVGCGTGLSTRAWDCARTGIDPSPELIKIAMANDPLGTYLVGEAEHLPFKDGSFDIVVSVSAIHNFHDPMKGLSEIKRVGRQVFALSVLKRCKGFQAISRAILLNFPISKIVKDDKDIIFLALKEQNL